MKYLYTNVNVKVRFNLEHSVKTQVGSRSTALLFHYPQHQVGVGGHCHTPATLHTGKTWQALCMRLDGPQGWSGWGQKILPPPGFKPQVVQPIESCYTCYTILAFYTMLYRKFWGLCHNVELYWVRQSVLLRGLEL